MSRKITHDNDLYNKMLQDDDVRRWHSNVGKNSVITGDIYLRCLGRFLSTTDMTAKQFIKQSRKKMEDIVQDYVDGLEKSVNAGTGEPYSPGYIANHLKAIRSWAEFSGKQIQRRIKIANTQRRPTLKDERVPTQEELKRVLYAPTTSLRTRSAIILISHAGLRIETLGDYLGVNGLKISDVKDFSLKDNRVSAQTVPAMIVVPPELSKSRRQYVAFLSREGCDVLTEYLNERARAGEKLTPDTGIIATSSAHFGKNRFPGIVDRSPFLRTTKIGNEIRVAMRAVGLTQRPYVWRSFFDTQLMIAESRQRISHAYRMFFMGHVGDIEATYTTNKNRLPEDVIADMTNSYDQCAEYLETSASHHESGPHVHSVILKSIGYTEEEIDALGGIEQIPESKISELIKQKVVSNLVNNGNRQKVVSQKDIENYLKEGWEFVSVIDRDKAVIRLPG